MPTCCLVLFDSLYMIPNCKQPYHIAKKNNSGQEVPQEAPTAIVVPRQQVTARTYSCTTLACVAAYCHVSRVCSVHVCTTECSTAKLTFCTHYTVRYCNINRL
jgi:hypothetical protein